MEKDHEPRIHFVHRLLRARDWQDRPELEHLCDWWRDGPGGVCALVGMGGAGKTAIAERFLRLMPGVLPDGGPKDETLVPPRHLFAYSFYDSANADDFFSRLAAWLRGEPFDQAVPPASSFEQTRALLTQTRDCFIVADGLEKLQSTGTPDSPLGHIDDDRLRELVLYAAEGYPPPVRMLVTTRFRLFDPMVARSPLFLPIEVERLSPEACVALLRQRGVKRGTDDELWSIARDQGFHAFSVDLAGGYIVYFCEGVPSRLGPEPGLPKDIGGGAVLDPRIAAIREQEIRFARLAEHYHEALSQTDPAALELLQRVCLFRLGVMAETLALIFTGEGKSQISGAALAGLDEDSLRTRLDLLVEMKLLERDEGEGGLTEIFTAHPAIRSSFKKSLDAETSKLTHTAVRKSLQVSLDSTFGAGTNPSSPATLDLLEEIIFHTLQAGEPQLAFSTLTYEMGGYQNIGWRLGAYERGARICRMFIEQYSSRDGRPIDRLNKAALSLFMNEYAHYLKNQGNLHESAHWYQKGIEFYAINAWWLDAARTCRNLAEVLLLTGDLHSAQESAEQALLYDENISKLQSRKSLAYLAYAKALRGEMSSARLEFSKAELSSHHPVYLEDIYYAIYLVLRGDTDEAEHRAMVSCDSLLEDDIARKHLMPRWKLLLADLARERNDIRTASRLLEEARDWAVARDAKGLLCWAALVRARVENRRLRGARSQSSSDGSSKRESHQAALTALDDGLRIARNCGFGIHHIDLLLERAQIALHEGDPDAATGDIHVALYAGVHPPSDSGRPALLAATESACGYASGIGLGRQLLAEAKLLRAAQKLGTAEFAPARFGALPAEIRLLIDEARCELRASSDLRRTIQDPRASDTERILADLDSGVLTGYPLTGPGPSATEEAPDPKGPSMKPARVFVSYSHRDESLKDELMRHLSILKRQGVIETWHDRMIAVGEEWKGEIDHNLETADVVLLLISADFIASDYCYDVEMKRALERHEAGETRVIPIILRQVDWKGAPFAKLQASPKDARAVTDWSDRDAAFTDVAKEIRRIVLP